MAKEYGFGVIGGGMIGAFHAEAIGMLPNAKLAAVCDNVPEAAKQFGQKCGCGSMSDLEAFLSRDDIDVVTVATPSGTHADIAIAAAKHGKHCVAEKPLDTGL